MQCHTGIRLGAVVPGLLDTDAARAHQRAVGKPGAHRKAGSVDDRVGVVVDTVDGANPDRGHLLKGGRDHLDAAPAAQANAAPPRNGPARRNGEDLDRRRQTGNPVDQLTGAGIGADDGDALSGRGEMRGGHRSMHGGATKISAAHHLRDQRNERRLAGDHYAGSAGCAVCGGEGPGVGVVVEHRADHLAVENHEVVDAGGNQLGRGVCVTGQDDAVDGLGHRNLARVQPRRAIGPIRPTSSRNSANGANPATCTSWRCGLLRAILRASRALRPARAYWTRLVNR